MILSVDPGKRIGVAFWTEEGRCQFRVVMTFEELDDFFETDRYIEEIVYEGFRLDHRAARQKGSNVDAAQVIGMLKSQARRRGIDIRSQTNTILPVAALHAGIKLPKGHLPDELSAYLHGFYYLEEAHGFRPSQLRELNPYTG